MPVEREGKRYDTAKYESLTNEELEEILRLDSEACEGEELDADEILRILEVLAEREAVCEEKSAQKAWESFCKNYMPENQRKDNFSKGIRRRTRHWIALAASIAIVICISVVGGAVGWGRISGAVANWTKDFFSFSNAGEKQKAPSSEYTFVTDNAGLQQLYDTVVAEGITDPVVPMWLPEGYELNELKVEPAVDGRKVVAAFEKNNEKLVISYRISVEKIFAKYEKGDSQVKQYEVDGTSHYVFVNKETTSVAWVVEAAECVLSAALDETTLQKIIYSIYRSE